MRLPVRGTQTNTSGYRLLPNPVKSLRVLGNRGGGRIGFAGNRLRMVFPVLPPWDFCVQYFPICTYMAGFLSAKAPATNLLSLRPKMQPVVKSPSEGAEASRQLNSVK